MLAGLHTRLGGCSSCSQDTLRCWLKHPAEHPAPRYGDAKQHSPCQCVAPELPVLSLGTPCSGMETVPLPGAENVGQGCLSQFPFGCY